MSRYSIHVTVSGWSAATKPSQLQPLFCLQLYTGPVFIPGMTTAVPITFNGHIAVIKVFLANNYHCKFRLQLPFTKFKVRHQKKMHWFKGISPGSTFVAISSPKSGIQPMPLERLAALYQPTTSPIAKMKLSAC